MTRKMKIKRCFDIKPWRRVLIDLVSWWSTIFFTVWSSVGCRPLSTSATLVNTNLETPDGCCSVVLVYQMVNRREGSPSLLGSWTGVVEMGWGAEILAFSSAEISSIFFLRLQNCSLSGFWFIASLSCGKWFFWNGRNSTHLPTRGIREGLNTALIAH